MNSQADMTSRPGGADAGSGSAASAIAVADRRLRRSDLARKPLALEWIASELCLNCAKLDGQPLATCRAWHSLTLCRQVMGVVAERWDEFGGVRFVEASLGALLYHAHTVYLVDIALPVEKELQGDPESAALAHDHLTNEMRRMILAKAGVRDLPPDLQGIIEEEDDRVSRMEAEASASRASRIFRIFRRRAQADELVFEQVQLEIALKARDSSPRTLLSEQFQLKFHQLRHLLLEGRAELARDAAIATRHP